ncbi:ATP-dependent DNA helicase RecG [Canibacter zhoujuaniae]|uniref:ATP-dependent DNA helicase RecG n=1 Tax=Canibacter zhoujuaniae TaxID=2708343 RepID=UPI0014239374|nr:ATP-dependent DNA helicase RecG [Canibacter zhoujuaniae]
MTTAGLDSSLQSVLGVKHAKAIERAFGYRTVEELLLHMPRRYSKRGELTPLTSLPLGEHVTIVARILDVQKRTMAARRGSILSVRVTDGNGFLSLTFFNQPWREKDLIAGRSGQFAGKVTEYRGQFQLQNPDYELFDSGAEVAAAGGDIQALRDAAALAYSKRPVPVYPATGALPSWAIAKHIAHVLQEIQEIRDPLADSLLQRIGIVNLDTALRGVHQPETEGDYRAAQHSLKFREAFALQLAFGVLAQRAKAHAATPRPLNEHGLLQRFDGALPYTLTGDQIAAGETFTAELNRAYPMARLLQGEVGSGKTVVALRAMLQVADSDGQTALLAPTEVLAGQHFRSVCELLGPELTAELKPVLLTGSLNTKERKQTLLKIVSGESKIVIGTHALISDATQFFDLGLVVVDEQHRFGVEQRDALRRKGRTWPHLLAMTATPIPRTVALTAFGELEITTLQELPAGRVGINSHAVQVRQQPQLVARVWQRALEEIANGRQVYVVCPAIDVETGGGSAANPDAAAPKARAGVAQIAASLRLRDDFQRVTVGELTGQLSADAKEAVMQDFAAGAIDVLVATTVIEVGVNVPNATMMIVLEADRFGVSQLHQLRGRVGRGAHAGLCLFLTEAEPGTPGWERVAAVANTGDGFELAEFDLEQRREGDILGNAQSGGKSRLRLLRVLNDAEIIYAARELVDALLQQDPTLEKHPQLRDMVAADLNNAAQLDKT